MRQAQTTLAVNIRRLRKARGWSQKQLAQAAGTTTVAMLESGKVLNPKADTIIGIAGALGVTAESLFRARARRSA